MKKQFLLALTLLPSLALSQSMLKYYDEPVQRYFGYQHGDNLLIDEPYALYMDGVLYQKGYTDSEGHIKAIQKPGVKYITVKWIGSESLYEIAEGANDKWRDQGVFEGYYDNGQLKRETFYDKDSRQGLQTTWFETGEKESETPFNQDYIKGDVITWHPNGTMAKKAAYRYNQEDGLVQEWNESGLLMKEYKAIKGKCFARITERNAAGELETRSCLTKNLTIPD